MLAASAVFLSQWVVAKKDTWDATMRHYTSFVFNDIKKCVSSLTNWIFLHDKDQKLNAAYKRYEKMKFFGVSKLPIPELDRLNALLS